MKEIFLLRDTRTVATYKHYVGKTVRKLYEGKVFKMRLTLFDPATIEYRKEKVNVVVTDITNKIVTVEVI